jgi:hypothetical protein
MLMTEARAAEDGMRDHKSIGMESKDSDSAHHNTRSITGPESQ